MTVALSPRNSRALLPRVEGGEVDLIAVDAALGALSRERATERPRARGPLASLLAALDALDARETPTVPREAPPAALRVPTPPARVADLESLSEPAPLPISEPAITLESLPPAPAERAVVLTSPLSHATPVDGLREPSLPPPRAAAEPMPELDVRLSLPPLEALDDPYAAAIPQGPQPMGSDLRALIGDVAVRGAGANGEALELDLSELGASDLPPQHGARSEFSELDVEAIDDVEVLELEDVRVARESSPPATPPRRPPNASAPPFPPPLRKLR